MFIFNCQAQIYDLTKTLDNSTPVFPGEPAFTTNDISTVNDNAMVKMRLMTAT